MANSSLLIPNIKLNPLITQHFPIIPFLPKSLNFPRLIINPRLTLKCSVTSTTLNKPVSKTAKKETRRNASETTFVESVSVDASGPPSITPQKIFSIASMSIIGLTVLAVCLTVLAGCLTLLAIIADEFLPRPKTVLKLQVGLLGSATSIQRDLNLIDRVEDRTQTYILTETTLAILRRSDYCISGYSSCAVKFNREGYERRFRWLYVEECGKFDKDTLVNRINKQSTSRKKSTGYNNEHIVVTILVAAKGVYTMPTISSSEDLKKALKILGSITKNETLMVEVLLNPKYENVKLTEQQMLEDYPHLRLFK